VDAYTTALTLLSRRELSAKQLRQRLARRQFDTDEIETVIERLTRDRTLDDRRVAVAAARMEATIKRRGRRRVLQRIQQLGIGADIAKTAVDDVFADVDERRLLEQAIERRLKGADPRTLDARQVARIARGLVAQGFEPGVVYARLKRMSAVVVDEPSESGE
jgi:regulatory protein